MVTTNMSYLYLISAVVWGILLGKSVLTPTYGDESYQWKISTILAESALVLINLILFIRY